MKKTILKALAVASVLSPAVLFAQTAYTKPTMATYITKDEIDQVSATDVIHRASTRTPPPPPAARPAGVAAAPVEICGRKMDTLPPGGTPGGIVHDFQTEGYYIVSGGGTMFTDGYIVNGHKGNNNASEGPRYYAAFGSIIFDQAAGNSNYQSLQVALNKRVTQGLQFQFAYTWSKLLDNRESGTATEGSDNPWQVPAAFLGEAGNIEFRAELFNILNHPDFAQLVATVWAGTGAGGRNFSGADRNNSGSSIRYGGADFIYCGDLATNRIGAKTHFLIAEDGI